MFRRSVGTWVMVTWLDTAPSWIPAGRVATPEVRGTHGTSTDGDPRHGGHDVGRGARCRGRSEEHTSELQSRFDLVCRLLLEKKKRIDLARTDSSLRLIDVT